jgi:hypothetical protein
MFRSLFVPSILSLSAFVGCSGAATTSSTSTDQAALTEAEASASDAQATIDACRAAFDTCKANAEASATADDCRAQLKECLPAEAHPGPRCGPHRGKGRGNPRGPNGDCDGGKPDGDRPDGGPPRDGEQRDHGGGGKEPGFCKHVPLPPPAEVVACRDAADACIAAGTDKKTCFDAEHACVKAAFDAAKAAGAASSE